MHGFPTATTSEGKSFVTMLPAPTTTLSPIVIPGRIIAPAPIKQFLPICIGILYWYAFSLRLGRIGCPAVATVTFGPNIVFIFL